MSAVATELYTHENIFKTIILPLYQKYPEISWFANDNVAASNEGAAKEDSEQSWTLSLAQAQTFQYKGKKYIELERMLHSVVCFNLLMDGSEQAYQYWIRGQATDKLLKVSFDVLKNMAKKYINSPVLREAVEASLVYSDLGKTSEAKKRAQFVNIHQKDHDDFMEAVYSAPRDILVKIAPSFTKLDEDAKNIILNLHLAIPLHWGHASHLEGGKSMFTRLVKRKKKIGESISPSLMDAYVKMAFLIQVCDVAASRAHESLQGFKPFVDATFRCYYTVLTTVENLLQNNNSNEDTALTTLANYTANQLGYDLKEDKEKAENLVIARMGAFLRFSTKEEGATLKHAVEAFTKSNPSEWELVKVQFALTSGFNAWKRNPTYAPTVVLNLFSSSKTKATERYLVAIRGFVVLAKITAQYEKYGHHNSDMPLCLNGLARQAYDNPEWFTAVVDITELDWSKPSDVVIKTKTTEKPPLILSFEASIKAASVVVNPIEETCKNITGNNQIANAAIAACGDKFQVDTKNIKL